MGFFSGLLGSVGSTIVGGIANKIFGDDDQPQQTTQRVNFKQLRNDAQKAGFNPLTALFATGGSGNTTTTHPTMSSGSFIAEAFERGADYVFNREKYVRDEELDEIRRDMAKEELTRMRNQNALPLHQQFGFSIPDAVTSSEDKQVSPILQQPLEDGRRTRTNANHSDDTNWIDPRVVDAETAEARYGDLAQEIAGLRNSVRDNVYNVRQSRIERAYGREVAQAIHDDLERDPTQSYYDVVRRHVEGKSPVWEGREQTHEPALTSGSDRRRHRRGR